MCMNCGAKAADVFGRIEDNLSFTEDDLMLFCVPKDECEWILCQFVLDCREEQEAGYNTYNPNETKEERIGRYVALMDRAMINAIGEEFISR